MKLVDLDPKWLIQDGKRIGFTFRSPTNPKWRQSCFAVSGEPMRKQMELFWEEDLKPDSPYEGTQGCDPNCAWTIAGGIDGATFETMSVTPSIDGSKGGLWHGHIKNGEIEGGV